MYYVSTPGPWIKTVMGGSLWKKDRMVTHILFDQCLHFSPVANFGNQSLCQLRIVKNKYVVERRYSFFNQLS